MWASEYMWGSSVRAARLTGLVPYSPPPGGWRARLSFITRVGQRTVSPHLQLLYLSLDSL